MSVRDIPPLPGEITRIRYNAYIVQEIGVIDGHYEALYEEGEYEEPPAIPGKGIAIIFPDKEEGD